VITRRRVLAVLGGGALAAPALARAQPAKPARIAVLGLGTAESTASRLDALRGGLRDFGYVEGKSVVFDYRWGGSNPTRLADLADELAQLEPAVFLAEGTTGTRAAKRSTASIPIVMIAALDAVGARFISSVARPGGNITGTTLFSLETSAHRLEVLKDALPRVAQLGLLLNPENRETEILRQATDLAAQTVKMTVQGFEARTPERLESAFTAMGRSGVQAVAVQRDPMFAANAPSIAQLAVRQRLPSIGDRGFAQAGGLIGHEMDAIEVWRRTAYFVDKILKGRRPAEMPVERIQKFVVVMNLRTAKALRVTIPPYVLGRADEVIR
jgi:putative tryptophan/tyrosine transport system substrate-binding protein